MKTVRFLLTALALCIANVALADDVNIPTTEENPFDLTKGVITSSDTHEHFTNNGVEWMMDGDKIVFTLQNQEDADYYNVYMNADTGNNDVTIDLLLKSQNGTTMADTTFSIQRKGWYSPATYYTRTAKMDKGKYTLTLTFHSTPGNSTANISSISFRDSKKLQPGDEVKLVNAEFSNGMTGWTHSSGSFYTSASELGDTIGWWSGSSPYSIAQTITELPNGIYLIQVNAYDQGLRTISNDFSKVEQWLAEGNIAETYVFANDQQVLMKNVLDHALTGQNIYRWYKGLSTHDCYFTNEAATCYMPRVDDKSSHIALAHHPKLYLNSVVCAVTDGQLTLGWRKTDSNREAPVFFDHFRVTYLSTQVSQLQHYIDEQKAAELSNEALNKLIDERDEQERQAMQMLEITVEQPGTLGDEIFAQMGNDFNLPDLKRLRIKGQLNEADLITLRDRCTGLVEIDMSKMLNTALVNGQFKNHYYLRYVTLPDYLESLPNDAFNQCYNLNTVKLPATMKEIGSWAFNQCYNLRQAVLPEGIKTIGDGCYNTSGVRQVILPSTLKTIPDNAFRYNYELTDLQFNGQTTIKRGNSAFGSATHLKILKMPSTMESIGDNAFEKCSKLEDVQLNEGLVEIWSNAFNSCAMKQLTLPSSVQGLYGQPFQYCDSLKELTCLSVVPPYTNYNNNPFGGREADKGRTISVPYISQTVYKQTGGWDQHNIVSHQQLPKNVYMNMPYNMTWPADLMATWKPNIHITTNAKNTSSEGGNGGMLSYGSLYVGSNASFSADTLSTYYSFYASKEADRRAFFTPMLINGTGRADVIVTEMNVSKDYWTFFSLPYDVKVSEITSTHPDDPFAIRAYDGKKRADGQNTEAWVTMTKDSTLHAGKGYIIRTTNDDFYQPYNNYFLPSVNNGNKPKYFTNDDVVVPLANYPTEFAHNRSWNFIGNPYPCYFDIRAMQTTAPITIWNRSSKYETYSPLDDDYILNPGQALFIQRPLDQSQVIFLKEGRQLDRNVRDTIYYSSSRAKVAGMQRQVYNLVLQAPLSSPEGDTAALANETLDRTRFVINEAATCGYDISFDASKFFSTEAGIAHLYTIEDGVSYAINERPLSNGEIKLGLQLSTEGTYTISLSPLKSYLSPLEVTLIDLATGTETLLTPSSGENEGVAYTFTAAAGTTNDRFIIRLGGATNGIESVTNEPQQTEQLFDLQGRPVNSSLSTLHSSLKKGIYVKDGKKVVVK